MKRITLCIDVKDNQAAAAVIRVLDLAQAATTTLVTNWDHCVDDVGPDPRADSKAGQHSNYEVFYHDGTSDLCFDGPGWYAWACMPGCLPDGEAHGPYNTSEEADFAHNAPDQDMEQAP